VVRVGVDAGSAHRALPEACVGEGSVSCAGGAAHNVSHVVDGSTGVSWWTVDSAGCTISAMTDLKEWAL
jgi:hypothetical protein